MKDLVNATWIKTKGLLFLLLGLLTAALLISDHPTLRRELLLAITVWSFCRFYYFAFYVIEHYVDSSFKFSGLFAFAVYLLKTKRAKT